MTDLSNSLEAERLAWATLREHATNRRLAADRTPARNPLMQVALALEGVWGRRRLAASPN